VKIGLIVPGFQSDAADWCIPALTAWPRWASARACTASGQWRKPVVMPVVVTKLMRIYDE
jgi:hypothetical protein